MTPEHLKDGPRSVREPEQFRGEQHCRATRRPSRAWHVCALESTPRARRLLDEPHRHLRSERICLVSAGFRDPARALRVDGCGFGSVACASALRFVDRDSQVDASPRVTGVKTPYPPPRGDSDVDPPVRVRVVRPLRPRNSIARPGLSAVQTRSRLVYACSKGAHLSARCPAHQSPGVPPAITLAPRRARTSGASKPSTQSCGSGNSTPKRAKASLSAARARTP
jgi:hypothetical protein